MPVTAFPRSLVLLALLIAVPGVLWGILSQMDAEIFEMTLPMTFFFSGFALFKLALSLEAGSVLRAGGEAADTLVAAHGSVAAVRWWMAWKLAAVCSATLGAVVCAVVAFG